MIIVHVMQYKNTFTNGLLARKLLSIYHMFTCSRLKLNPLIELVVIRKKIFASFQQKMCKLPKRIIKLMTTGQCLM